MISLRSYFLINEINNSFRNNPLNQNSEKVIIRESLLGDRTNAMREADAARFSSRWDDTEPVAQKKVVSKKADSKPTEQEEESFWDSSWMPKNNPKFQSRYAQLNSKDREEIPETSQQQKEEVSKKAVRKKTTSTPTEQPEIDDDEISGQETAGIAVQKGASRVGEEIGNIGKRVVDFASEQPGAAGLAAGVGAAALLMRKRKQQL